MFREFREIDHAIKQATPAIEKSKIPNGNAIFSQMLVNIIVKDFFPAEGSIRAIFAALPEEDIQKLLKVVKLVKNHRTEILNWKGKVEE